MKNEKKEEIEWIFEILSGRVSERKCVCVCDVRERGERWESFMHIQIYKIADQK